jgi:hypothetical protein
MGGFVGVSVLSNASIRLMIALLAITTRASA